MSENSAEWLGTPVLKRNHIGLALRTFLCLEQHCHHVGISGFEAKTAIIRSAVRAYLANSLYTLPGTA